MTPPTESTAAPAAQDWIRRPADREDARLRILCFPHAGGSPIAFRQWAGHLPADVAVDVVCYPGRLDRIAEDPIEDMGQLLDRLEPAYRRLEPRPTVFFGHSMGAAIAHELTLRVAGSAWEPRLLVVSGRAAPHRATPRGIVAGGDDAIVADVVGLTPESEPVMADPEMRGLLLPGIRADYRLIENHHTGERPRIDVPILALAGVSDPIVDPADVACWKDATTASFTLREFEGGHFFLDDNLPEVVTALTDLADTGRDDAEDSTA